MPERAIIDPRMLEIARQFGANTSVRHAEIMAGFMAGARAALEAPETLREVVHLFESASFPDIGDDSMNLKQATQQQISLFQQILHGES